MRLAENTEDPNDALEHYMNALKSFRETMSNYLRENEDTSTNILEPIIDPIGPPEPEDLDEEIKENTIRLITKFQEQIEKKFSVYYDEVEEMLEFLPEEAEEIKEKVERVQNKIEKVKERSNKGKFNEAVELLDEDLDSFDEDLDYLDEKNNTKTTKKIEKMEEDARKEKEAQERKARKEKENKKNKKPVKPVTANNDNKPEPQTNEPNNQNEETIEKTPPGQENNNPLGNKIAHKKMTRTLHQDKIKRIPERIKKTINC